MFKKIIATDSDLGSMIIRFVLGIVMFQHGAQKALGWYGGHGFSGTVEAFTQMGMPAAVAVLIILGEFLGSLGLLLGLLTRIAAGGMLVIMVGAISLVHFQNGFFMNWFGAQAGEGFEYHLLVIGMSLALLVRGGGANSLDCSLGKPRASYGKTLH